MGSISEIITAAVAAITLCFSVLVQYKSKKMQAQNIERQKRLETVKAYNELQKHTLSQLTESAGYYQSIADKARTESGRDEYRRTKELVSECEHFSAGVELGLYDYETVLALSGTHLYWKYKCVKPIVEKSRSVAGNDKESRYAYFEKLAERIRISNGINQ